MFIFFGTGSNGKSIIIEHIYKKFFDKKFMSSMSLNALSKEDNAARKQLLTARVNFATEQKASSDIESDELKKIINGEDISIRRMYQDTITHAPKCKIMVAENRFARFKDTSEGTRRRLFMINFPNRFEKDPVKYKKIKNPRQYRVFPALYEEDIIKNLNNELPAILNIFLDGLEELRKNHWNIIESKNSEDIFNEYIKESDYVGSWLEENFEKDDNEKESLSVKEVLNKYREWWLYHFPEKKFDMSTKLLGRRIKELFRIDSHQLVVRIGEDNITTTSVYYLKTKIDETWELIHNSQPTNDLKQMSF
jgi:phage/plasmid-associated DNA primase